MHDDIQKLGAQAARNGLTLWDCPYYQAAAMPGHTGESIMEWREKVDAWEAGWCAEAQSWRPADSSWIPIKARSDTQQSGSVKPPPEIRKAQDST
ncbi:hypothetical protein D3C86_2018680 [compost metagenome]